MGHYDQFEIHDTPRSRRNGSFVDQYNEKLDKKYSVFAKCLVPQGNTAQFVNNIIAKTRATNTIDDALGFCYEDIEKNRRMINKPKDVEYVLSEDINKDSLKPRKHSKGKADGARFCYLSSIAAASEYAETAADHVGRHLDNLLTYEYEVSRQITFMMIVEYAAIAVGTHKELFDGVIAVRAKALESGKYTQESWKEPIDVDLLLDAAARHLISYLYVDEIDDESGENHMAHIVANVLMIAQQLRGEQDAD